ncbi:sigma-70 family RNA polymerase sigma factor [Comamonas composti]|uniref:sigma-70 family RNA polymerase sigma factor n=1 Tax=Comamonas composti TaxID=408558 RepID=UPI00047B68FA|nr:sigma-70 family RNA polymerase sigma factor [Comamonas composti]
MTSPSSLLHREVATLYTDHHGWLQTWLRKKLGDVHQAADLAHDTFVRLLAREEPVQAREPRAFLTTVAQRVLANHYRRQKLERAYLEALAQMPQAMAPSPEERALLLEALDAIDRMLDGLPAPVRRAFLLAQLDGMKQADIATTLGLSLTTVKRYLVQAGMHCMAAVAAEPT